MAGYGFASKGGPAPSFSARSYAEQQYQQQQYQQQQQYHQQQQQQQQQYQYYRQFQQDARQRRDAAPTSAPPSAHQQSARNLNRSSTRPPSSIYSQPSPVDAEFPHQPPSPLLSYQQASQHYRHTSGPVNEDGVSPVSSPELEAVAAGPIPPPLNLPRSDTRPVDVEERPSGMSATQAEAHADAPPDGRPPSASRSNIPKMRREKRQNQETAARALRETKSRERLNQSLNQMQERTSSIASSTRGYKGGEVRWDPQTGELTSSQKGRPSQVKPAEYARGLASTVGDAASLPVPAAKDTPSPVAATSGIASFASRLRRTVQGSSHGTAAGAATAAAAAVPRSLSPTKPTSPPSVSASASPLPSPISPQTALSSLPVATAQPRKVSTASTASTDPAAGAFTSNRPAWQGASGRTALVAPVHDKLDAPPLNIPRKSSKRVASVPRLSDAATPNSPNSLSSPPPQNNPSIASPPVSPPPLGAETQDQAILRHKGGAAAAAAATAAASGQSAAALTTKKLPASPAAAAAAQSYPSPPLSADPTYKESLASQQPQQPAVIRRKPTPSHQSVASYDESDPFNYNRPHPSISPSPAVSPRPRGHDAEWTQPPSRFSVTTYSSTINESEHDPTGPPEMPPLPTSLRSGPQASPPRHKPSPILMKPLPGPGGEGESVMDRRRPPRMGHASPSSIKSGIEPVVISLKTPWMSGNHSHTERRDSAETGSNSSSGEENHGGRGGAPGALYGRLRNLNLDGARGGAPGVASDRASVAGSIHKNLPPAPPETSAKDRVTMLNAQLASLAQRRMNIDRSIKQMTELMPTDNLLAAPDVLHKREMEKRKVEGLRTELAEIQREEYEIGLKLHRAYKRLDKNAEYEPTTLWVRRVTG